jgi:hypothetical protein
MKIEAARLRSRVASLLRALPWLMLVLSGSFASAGMPPASHPDLSGYWNLSIRIPRDPELMSRLPPGTVVLNDTGPVELPARDFGGLKVKPAALAAALAWKPADDMTLSKACKAPSIIYAMQGPFPIEIYQGTEFIIIKLEYFDLVRIVFKPGQHVTPYECDPSFVVNYQQAQDRPPSAPAH